MKMPFAIQSLALTFCLLYPLGAALPVKTSPVAIDTTMAVRDFVLAEGQVKRAAMPEELRPKSTVLSPPTVTIFSPKGEPLYIGGSETAESVSKNLEMLRQFPQSVQGSKILLNVAQLRPMMDLVPDFKAQAKNIEQDGRYVIYVTVFVNPDRVTNTEKALMDIRSQAAALKVDTLLVRLQR